MKNISHYSLILSLLSTAVTAQAVTLLNLSTQTAAWTVSVPSVGITNTPAAAVNFPWGGNNIGVTSYEGTWVGGVDYTAAHAAFDGFWTAQTTFVLPTEATTIKLDFNGFEADDRAVMYLNGTEIGGTRKDFANGFMVFSYQGASTPYTFLAGESQSGTASGPFIPGGVNTLQVIMNNIDRSNPESLQGLVPNNGTFFQNTVQVSYDQIPEPSALLLLGSAGIALSLRRVRKKPSNDQIEGSCSIVVPSGGIS